MTKRLANHRRRDARNIYGMGILAVPIFVFLLFGLFGLTFRQWFPILMFGLMAFVTGRGIYFVLKTGQVESRTRWFKREEDPLQFAMLLVFYFVFFPVSVLGLIAVALAIFKRAVL